MKSKKQKSYYKEIIALMPGHVYWKDKNGAFLGCNLQQAKDAGFDSPDDMVGKTDDDMPWSIQADYLREVDKKVMRSGRPITIEELFETPDGTKKTYLSNKLPLYDDNNKIAGILGISFDISERKKLQEELVNAKEQAEAANQAKTEFLENMRHDIRTPLSGIVGFAEIIKTQAKDPKIAEYAENLTAASYSLLDFLNEILEGIKVFSGEIPEVRQKFCLHDLIAKTIDLLNPKALEKNLYINLGYEKIIPKYIIGDPKRIQRILLELITNALNFTDKGGVNINFNLIKNQDKGLVIKCVVEDTGIGIAEDKQEEVFLRFKRLTPSYNGIYKGAGLGLAIVKQFVDDLQGEIYCQSQAGKGTLFTLLFPVQESLLEDATGTVDVNDIVPQQSIQRKNLKSPKNRKKSSRSKTRILLVEDQPLAAKVAEHIVVGLNCSVDIGTDGKSASDLLRENNYDLIFMDIGLPDTTGYDLTKRIRSDEWKLGNHVPIVALTAHVDDENKLTCIESGMDAVLSKPLTDNRAKEIISTFVPFHRFHDKESEKSTQSNLFILEGKSVDIESGIAKLGGGVESAQEMISILVKGFLEDLPKLEDAKNKNDWDAIKSLVHKHRGGSYYCGTPRFEQACTNLEQYLLSNKKALRNKLYQQLLDEFESIHRQEKEWC